jgi:hypothetical protein
LIRRPGVVAVRWPVRPVSKYGAVAITVDGIRFDSKREARRYRELLLLALSGEIQALELQPRFPLNVVELFKVAGSDPIPIVTCGHYTADFRYVVAGSGEVVIEDVKAPATRTTAYKLRKRIVEAVHGVSICEV